MKAMTLRLPDDLHEELRREAFERRVPITTLIVAAIRQRPPKGGGCDVCGAPHVMVSTPGGIRFCQTHRPSDPSSEVVDRGLLRNGGAICGSDAGPSSWGGGALSAHGSPTPS